MPYTPSDPVGSPNYRRRARIHDMNRAVGVAIATSPRRMYQPKVSKTYPGKCGTALAWKLPDLAPSIKLQARVRCLNDIDWGDPSGPSPPLWLPCKAVLCRRCALSGFKPLASITRVFLLLDLSCLPSIRSVWQHKLRFKMRILRL